MVRVIRRLREMPRDEYDELVQEAYDPLEGDTHTLLEQLQADSDGILPEEHWAPYKVRSLNETVAGAVRYN